jgi:tRNA1Val (adenine37-N6)-methyltransferase
VTDVTDDSLFGGQVALRQPARGAGYRTNVDALLLAAFAAEGCARARGTCAYDLGAGPGAVALSLLHIDAVERVVLVEIDAEVARIAGENLDANGWAHRSVVVCADVVEAARARAGEASVVVCNPPYFEPGRGHRATEPTRARARSGELRGFAVAARALAGRRAKVSYIYPARELAPLLETLRAAGLEPKRMRLVRAGATSPARVVMVESMLARSGGLIILPDLVERESGVYTPELQAILRRDRVDPATRER